MRKAVQAFALAELKHPGVSRVPVPGTLVLAVRVGSEI